MNADLTALSRKDLRKKGAEDAIQSAKACAVLLQNNADEVERICIHEAGHVAMCEILGVPVQKFSGPGVSVNSDDNGTKLDTHMAMVTHDNTTRWGSVNPYVALKQKALICVAGEAAEYVVLNDPLEQALEIRWGYPEYSDCGSYDSSHSGKWDLPNLHLSKKELDNKWKLDFLTAAAIFKAVDARKLLDDATARFRRFMTTNLHIDLSTILPQQRRSREVAKKVTELTNELMGPNAALDNTLKYSASRAVAFDMLGVRTRFKGPSIQYNGVKGDVKDLKGVAGGLTVPSDWVDKLMRPLTDPKAKRDMLVKIAGAMLSGNIFVYGDADRGYGRSKVGESNYTLDNKIVKLFAKYDDKTKSIEAGFDARVGERCYSTTLWKQRRKFHESLVKPIRKFVLTAAEDAKVKEVIAAKVREFEQLIAKK